MNTAIIQVEGVQEIADLLRGLGNEGVKILRRGMSTGAAIVRNEIKARAPVASKPHKRGGRLVPPGTIKRSPVSVWARELSDADDQAFLVVLRRGKKYQRMGKKQINKDAYYWPWVEYGHKIVPRKGKQNGGGSTYYTQRLRNGEMATRKKEWSAASITGRRRSATGFVPPHPFFIPAYNASAARASDAIATRILAEIEKAIA